MAGDFFCSYLDRMIDLRQLLAMLANCMPWQGVKASLAQRRARQVKAGKRIEDLDLFGPVSALTGGGISNAGRPRLPTPLLVALLHLKHAFNESDEDILQRWGEAPNWQFFSGNNYFERRWQCDPTQLGRFRKALGEEGVEELLVRVMEVAVTHKLIGTKELTRVIVDSTLQEKAVAHPTDSKLLETVRAKVFEPAKAAGIELELTHAKQGRKPHFKAGSYVHARQFKRMRKSVKRRQAIEAIIGPLKADLRMGRCHLKGSEGDATHAVLCCAVLCSAGYTIRWLAQMTARRDQGLSLCLFQAAGLMALPAKFAEIIIRNHLQRSDQCWALT